MTMQGQDFVACPCGTHNKKTRFKFILAICSIRDIIDNERILCAKGVTIKMTKVQKYTGEYLKQSLEELLNEIANSITSQYPDSRVILFGSYARGDYSKDSDFDICVLVPQITENRSDMRVDMACAVRKDFPMPFDIILYTFDEFEKYSKSKSRLQYKIKTEGIELHG